MKTWAWIAGAGAVVGGVLWWRSRKALPVESYYPPGVVPGETPSYPIPPSADQLPPDTEGAANATSASFVEPSVQSVAQSGSTYVAAKSAVGGASSSTPTGATATSAKAYPIVPLRIQAMPVSKTTVPLSTTSTKTELVTTTYKSPVTSTTTSVVVPIVKEKAPITTFAVAPTAKTLVPKVRTDVIRPTTVVKPTALRGIYAIGADHTEAEYRALAARAQLESKRREWAASQMANQIAAIRRNY